jgi:hypothetical protein
VGSDRPLSQRVNRPRVTRPRVTISAEVDQREHMVRWVFTGSAGLSSCVLVAISPRRAKLGGLPRGMRSAETPPPIPTAGAPPAGPWQELVWQFALQRPVGCDIPAGHWLWS